MSNKEKSLNKYRLYILKMTLEKTLQNIRKSLRHIGLAPAVISTLAGAGTIYGNTLELIDCTDQSRRSNHDSNGQEARTKVYCDGNGKEVKETVDYPSIDTSSDVDVVRTYDFDSSGNMVKQTERWTGKLAVNDKQVTLEYSAAGRRIKMFVDRRIDGTLDASESYEYGPSGKEIRRTSFIYESGKVVMTMIFEYDSRGNFARELVD